MATLSHPTDADRRLRRLDDQIEIDQVGRSATPPSASAEVCDDYPIHGRLRPSIAGVFTRAGDVSDCILGDLKRLARAGKWRYAMSRKTSLLPARVANANSLVSARGLQAVNRMRGAAGMDARRALFFELRAQVAQMTAGVAESDAPERSEGR